VISRTGVGAALRVRVGVEGKRVDGERDGEGKRVKIPTLLSAKNAERRVGHPFHKRKLEGGALPLSRFLRQGGGVDVFHSFILLLCSVQYEIPRSPVFVRSTETRFSTMQSDPLA